MAHDTGEADRNAIVDAERDDQTDKHADDLVGRSADGRVDAHALDEQSAGLVDDRRLEARPSDVDRQRAGSRWQNVDRLSVRH